MKSPLFVSKRSLARLACLLVFLAGWLTAPAEGAEKKYQALFQKLAAVENTLDQDKSLQLRTEAQALMDELTGKNYSGSLEGVSKKPAPYEPTDMSQVGTKSILFSDKPIVEVDLKKSKGFGGWPWSPLEVRERKIEKGMELYKSALEDGVITLAEAEAIGLANNVELQAGQKKVDAAGGKLFEAKRALFPTTQFIIEENSGSVSGRAYRGRNYKLNLNQPLFYGGELMFTLKQAEENLKSAREEMKKLKGEYIHQVRTSYYGVVRGEYNLQYQRELFGEIKELRGRTREQFNQKLISEIDYLEVEAQYHESFFQSESARDDLLSAYLILFRDLYLPGEVDFPADLELAFDKVDPDFDTIAEIALRKNPELKIREHALLSAEYSIKVFKAKKMPRFDLRGSVGYLGEVFKDDQAIGTDNHDLDVEKEWFLGVNAKMPLGPHSVEYDHVKNVFGPTVLNLTGSDATRDKVTFNLFDSLADITDEQSAQESFFRARADYEKARQDLVINIREDFYNLQKSLIQVDSSMASIRYQEKKNKILEYMLGLQEASMEDYLEGLTSLAQDKFSFIQAVTDYNLAISGLGLSIGDINYFERKSD